MHTEEFVRAVLDERRRDRESSLCLESMRRARRAAANCTSTTCGGSGGT